MSIKYDFKENPPKEKGVKNEQLHPRVVVNGTCDTTDIANYIHEKSSFSTGDIKGVLTELFHFVTDRLANGYNVKIDGMGSFSVGLSAPPVTDRSEIHAQSVAVSNIYFHATPRFVGCVSGLSHLERADTKYGFSSSSSKYTQEERLQLLKDYFDSHSYITRREYSALTGLLRTKAADDLKEFEVQKVVKCNGRRPHYVYTLIQDLAESGR